MHSRFAARPSPVSPSRTDSGLGRAVASLRNGASPAPGAKLVRPQRPRIMGGCFRQHERSSGAAALGSLGGTAQTAAGPAKSAGEGLDALAGLTTRGPAGVGSATKNKLRRRRMYVISPPPLFPPRGPRCPRRGGSRHSERRTDGKSITSLPVVMLCRPGRKNKTEGLQYLEPKGNVLLGSPGERLTLRRQPGWCPNSSFIRRGAGSGPTQAAGRPDAIMNETSRVSGRGAAW